MEFQRHLMLSVKPPMISLQVRQKGHAMMPVQSNFLDSLTPFQACGS